MYNRSSRSDSRSKRITCSSLQAYNGEGVDTPYERQAEFCADEVPSDQQVHKLATFYDEHPSHTCIPKSNDDPTRDSAMDTNAMLATFFERPVKIQEFDWQVGTPFSTVFNPWADWFDNTRVKNRLSNFRNFRGDLHLKFLINGNSFYWGSLMASYYPLPVASRNPFYFTQAEFLPDLMAASQRPKILLDPTTNQGGEMVLPFFWDEDNYDITSGLMNDIGQIWMTSLVELNNVTGTNPINISVFAWVSDIKLSGPTAVNPTGLAPQAEKVTKASSGKDEFSEEGPISKPAAIISKIAGKLEKAPVIGPYAMATKMAATTVGSIAKQFGYCRPREISDPMQYKNTQTGDLATTDAVDTSASLALTAKRELTIDPRTTGLSEVDELEFKHLYMKESYLTSIPWQSSDLQSQILFSAPVTPMLANVDARTIPPTEDGTGLTPAGFVAAPFRYWRGTMCMRFQFVGSAYHKGRVILQWDPAAGSTTVETNLVFSQVIDVAEKRDFTMKVKWGSNFPALQVNGIPQQTNYEFLDVAPTNLNFHNGNIKMFVDNRLAYIATNTDPVAFNVFVSWEDLEVFGPESDAFNFWTPFPVFPAPPPAPAPPLLEKIGDAYERQAEVHMGDSKPSEQGAPDSAPTLNEVGGDQPLASAAFMHGDPIVSFRQIMKRYCFQNSVLWQETAPASSMNHTTISQKIYPLFRGTQAGALHSGGGENLIPTSMYAWVAMCYAGFRGSVRYKAFPRFDPRWAHYVRVNRLGSNTQYDITTSAFLYTNDNLNVVNTVFDESFSGRQLTVQQTMGNVLEFEVPFYANARFAYSYNRPDEVDRLGWTIEVDSMSRPTDVAESRQSFDIYVSCGDDMNFFFFRGVPTLYFFDKLPS